ncbi:lytic transglycosylase domain-containing protein [bacterium]|nr:lytic transglycosylase domain-containing protein [bacterium]
MKFLKTTVALLLVFCLTIAAKDYGIHDFFNSANEGSHVQLKETVTKQPEDLNTEVKSVFEIADSICQEVGVPFELVKEIGNNESGWRCIQNTNGGTDFGDLQVIDVTYDYWYKRLKLKGGKTRKNYLAIGIHYLKYNYDRYGSWKKARFAYGRGNWRPESTWTALERKFMSKIDWSKYDSPSYVMK